MAMNTPTGNITQTTAIKDFVELESIGTQQYLLGINNIAAGDGSKIKLEKLLENSISADTGNTLEIGSDNKLLNVEENTGVQAGTYAYPQNLVVNSKGKITSVASGSPASVPIATTLQAGIVKPDGTTITVTQDGTIHSESGSSRNIGEIVASTIPLTDAGLHLLDGSLIQGSGIYSDFVDYMLSIYDASASYFCTEAQWQTSVTTYGVCGKFVYNSTNNTVRLPKYNSKIYTGGGTAPVVGNGNALGVWGYSSASGNPKVHGALNATQSGNPIYNAPNIATGNYSMSSSSVNGQAIKHHTNIGVDTDPTKSGLIAQLSNITTSLDGYYYIVIATSTKTDIQVDIDEIATDLNGKADVDLTNVTDTAKIMMSGMAMPSGRYIDLTLGASGSTYTAPANGWILLNKNSGDTAKYIAFSVTRNGIQVYNQIQHSSFSGILSLTAPVTKGAVTRVEYSATGTTNYFRFIYAKGSESEAS